MALNPFFLQGSPNEQRLIQELINEQLKIYGVEVIYIPRKFVRKQTIIKEIQSSLFDDNFAIEAYLNNYEGYTGQGDILSKFGVSLRDEVSLIISKERFEDFIAPFMVESELDGELELSTRPREGDVIYFPLGQRLFEVKFVEHEQPFYQLGKLYVYELKCELFEYEDEIIDTSISEIDEQLQEEGYITTLNLVSIGLTATATVGINSGYIREIYINNDGYGYTSTPTVSISTAPSGGVNAQAVAITTTKGDAKSLFAIEMINSGAGYTVAPTITISGGGGVGASATCRIETSYSGISTFTITNNGQGYVVAPTITIVGNVGIGTSAIAKGIVGSGNSISSIRIINPGIGYTTPPTVTISQPSILTGIGTYHFNEIVTGSLSGTQARVKSWDKDTNVLKVSYADNVSNKGFYKGELIVGSSSNASYAVATYDNWDEYDKYSENLQIETEADSIIVFSESNPFGAF